MRQIVLRRRNDTVYSGVVEMKIDPVDAMFSAMASVPGRLFLVFGAFALGIATGMLGHLLLFWWKIGNPMSSTSGSFAALYLILVLAGLVYSFFHAMYQVLWISETVSGLFTVFSTGLLVITLFADWMIPGLAVFLCLVWVYRTSPRLTEIRAEQKDVM